MSLRITDTDFSTQAIGAGCLNQRSPKAQECTQIVCQRLSSYGEHGMQMHYSPQRGLVATLKLYGGAQFSDLPVVGLPAKCVRGPIQKLKSYLENAYWQPIKGSNGNIEKISVQPALKGGGQGKIPYQPGLALGSIVHADIIRKLNRYSDLVSESEELESQLNELDQKIIALDSKKTSLTSRVKDPGLKKAFEARIEVERDFITKYQEAIFAKLSEKKMIESIPVFTSFSSGLISPVDKTASREVVMKTGHDTLRFHSQYIDMAEESTSIQDKIEQASSSGSVSAKVGGGGFFFSASASFSTSWAKSTADRVASIQKSKRAEGVLVMNAMVTTRNVRCFEHIVFDRDRLQRIAHLMETATPDVLKGHGITMEPGVDGKDEPAIYMLNETVMGGSFTAFVTFLNTESMDRRAELHAQASERTTSAGASGSAWGWRASVNYTGSSSHASQSEKDALKSIQQTQVEIDIISQGVIPTFSRDVIEREIFRHLNLNPSKFELSTQDIADTKKLVEGSNQEKAIIEEQHRMKMANAQVGVMNSLRGLTAEKQKLTLHTANSAMDAYENYADKITTDEGCGVPIGFNYDRLSYSDIVALLKRIDSQDQKASAARGEGIDPQAQEAEADRLKRTRSPVLNQEKK